MKRQNYAIALFLITTIYLLAACVPVPQAPVASEPTEAEAMEKARLVAQGSTLGSFHKHATSLPVSQSSAVGDWLFLSDNDCDGIEFVNMLRLTSDQRLLNFASAEYGTWEEHDSEITIVIESVWGTKSYSFERTGDIYTSIISEPDWHACLSLWPTYKAKAAHYGVAGHNLVALADGRQLALGGNTNQWMPGASNALDQVLAFDPSTQTWSKLAKMNLHRARASSTLLSDGRILVSGGVGGSTGDGSWRVIDQADMIDPRTGQVSSTRKMPYAVEGHQTVLLQDGRVLISGGMFSDSDDHYTVLDKNAIYDPASRRWKQAASMASPRLYPSLATLPDGRVLVAGGMIDSDRYTAEVEIYDPISDIWTAAPELPEARAGHVTVQLPDGKLMLIGGENELGSLNNALLFDPSEQTWSDLGMMPALHGSYAQAELLADGTVIVLGGYWSTSDVLASVSRYNPVTKQWSQLEPMAFHRYYFTTSLLPDGRIFIVGGLSGNSQTIPISEIYDPLTEESETVPDLEW